MYGYGDRLTIDYGASQGSGNALLTYRLDSIAFGIAAHRGDAYGGRRDAGTEGRALSNPTLPLIPPLEVVGDSLPLYPFADAGTYTAADILVGTDVWGLRASAGTGGEGFDPDSGGLTGTQHTSLSLLLGVSPKLTGFRLDTSAQLSIDSAKALSDGDTALTGVLIDFIARGRGYYPLTKHVELGMLANVGITSQRVTDPTQAGDPIQAGVRYDLRVGAGPVWSINDRLQAAAYATLRADLIRGDANSESDGDAFSQNTIYIPEVQIAVDAAVLDWLYLRSGVLYNYTSTSRGFDENVGGGTQTLRGGAYGWNAGLGVVLDRARFDATFQPGALTSGLALIGGERTFAMVSLTLDIDQVVAQETAPGDVTQASPTESDSDSRTQPVVASQATPNTSTPAPTVPLASTTAPDKATAPELPSAPTSMSTSPSETEHVGSPVTPPPSDIKADPPASNEIPETQAQPAGEPDASLIDVFRVDEGTTVNDGTTTGSVARNWSVFYNGARFGTGHVLDVKDGEQILRLIEGSYGIERDVSGISGRTLTVSYRFDGGATFEILADEVVLHTQKQTFIGTQTMQIPDATAKLRLRVTSLDPETHVRVVVTGVELR